MNDQFWQSVRYVLIGGGAFIAGRYRIPADQVPVLVDQIIQVMSGLASLGGVVWGLYVKWQTATVPASTAARIDVPTVSAATGSVKP